MKQDLQFNEQTCSTSDSELHYRELWTLGQQEAVRRLSVKTRIEFKNTARYELIKDFSTRAERIAGNYARLYLELERNGKPELKGRFYWTGLAAFASKQVMCALDYASTSKWRWTGAAAPFFDITKMHLGEGNFWLFQDIFVWHWFYINYPDEFKNAAPERNWNCYISDFKTTFQELPWIDDALPKINFLAETTPLKEGFDLIKKVEALKDGILRRELQLASLMKIADHEQLWILQPLIYENWDFQLLLDGQAKLEGKFGVPRRLAAFSTQCETGGPDRDVVMKEGDLYDATDRMIFITEIANKYHYLMNKDKSQMETIISTISSWHNNE
ncbi:DUF2515 family protein [Pseudomonas sp. NPDC089396]|uniref:DUF2515 family protein n=1 Tax=Pseudomonas sp. NPDC089396 TaxID=3364461 RepID=UPI003834DEEF